MGKKVDEKKHGWKDAENYLSKQKRYNSMKSTTMRFNGQLLNRGFWLYCCKVSDGKREVLYVGRTGDSSSKNAASPFSRVFRHLDTRESAKGNTLHHQLKRAGMEPSECSYLLSAYGPVFKEPEDLAYVGFQDRMAALERELAYALKDAGYEVIGNHQSKKSVWKKRMKPRLRERWLPSRRTSVSYDASGFRGYPTIKYFPKSFKIFF